MGYIRVPWLLFLCGFGHDRPRGEWNAKSGVRLSGFGKHGTPFGRARLVLLMLAEKAAQSGRSIRLSIAEILEKFGLDWRGRNLAQHIDRVIDCVYEMVEKRCACSDGRCRPKGVKSIAFIANGSYCVKDKTFHIELRDEFVEAAQQSAVCSIDVIKVLARAEQFAALDLYCWYQWKLFRGDYGPVDPFGPDGPFGLVPIAKAETKARSDLRKLHRMVKQVWPECPFRVTGKGNERRIMYGPKQRASNSEVAGEASESGNLARTAVQAGASSTHKGASRAPRYRPLPKAQALQRLGPTRVNIARTVPSLPALLPVRSLDDLREEAERMRQNLQDLALSRSRGDPSD